MWKEVNLLSTNFSAKHTPSATLILLITFEPRVLQLWYFTRKFHDSRPLCEYQQFWPWPWSSTYFYKKKKKKKFNLANDIQQWVLELWYFTWIFLAIRSFFWYQFLKKIIVNLSLTPLLHGWNIAVTA